MSSVFNSIKQGLNEALVIAKGKKFTARMRKKPSNEQLKIRVRNDLLNQPTSVAINASVVY